MNAQSAQQGQPPFKEYEVIVGKFNAELQLFWTRANFYVLVQAGLLSFAVAILTLAADNKITWLAVEAVSGVGYSLGVFWLFTLMGSYGWITVWREEARSLDRQVNQPAFFSIAEDPDQTRPWRPAKITRFLPLLFMSAWTAVAVGAIWTVTKVSLATKLGISTEVALISLLVVFSVLDLTLRRQRRVEEEMGVRQRRIEEEMEARQRRIEGETGMNLAPNVRRFRIETKTFNAEFTIAPVRDMPETNRRFVWKIPSI
jgi:hypothetical protein